MDTSRFCVKSEKLRGYTNMRPSLLETLVTTRCRVQHGVEKGRLRSTGWLQEWGGGKGGQLIIL